MGVPSLKVPALPSALPTPTSLPKQETFISALSQESEGSVHRLRGDAVVETASMLVRADQIDYDEDSGDVRASGNIYFHEFERNEQIWADRLEYNTEEETGRFYDVRGETNPRIDARPGVLTSSSPFYFQGKWAERSGDKYILYNGFITNCKMPNPWWRLRGPKFVIEPDDKALAYRTTFLVRRMPLFYTPFFYKSLARSPRKSGFLMPNFGNSSQRGLMFGVGYFWAINRSYDVTYQVQDFTSRGFAHHVDFRGKPFAGTDFDAVLYGVQDRGVQSGDGPVQKYGGLSAYIVGKSDLGNGWNALASVNYLSSFRFRQQFTESYNEAIGSEIHSVGFLNKDWSSYTFNAVFARLENFQQAEIETTDPVTGQLHLEPDSVIIRKLPEAEFSGRERRIWNNLPIWYSFDSAAGLLYREEPIFQGSTLIDRFQTGQFMNRVNFEPRVMTAFHWKGIHLIPGFGLQETYYAETQTPFQDRYHVVGQNILRSSRDVSLDMIFPSVERVFNKKTIFGDKLKHVIEPRATYRYVTGIDNDYERIIRFDETDLASNTNELELSLTNRIYAKRGNQVQEIFTWELSQTRYFDPTFGGALIPGEANLVLSTADLTPYAFLVYPRSSSPIVSVLRMSPINGLGLQWSADYDHRRGQIIDSALSVDYRWSKYFISAGNNTVHLDPLLTPPANQFRIRTGFGDQNHRGWNAAVDAIYDYRKSVFQYATTQVTYNTNCCGISLQYRRFNVGARNENQFRVAFAIANIGTFGTLKKQDRLF